MPAPRYGKAPIGGRVALNVACRPEPTTPVRVPRKPPMSTGSDRAGFIPPVEPGSDLFEPVQLGPLRLANRIVMAPLTRSRADDEGVPGVFMAGYYAQRASAGLIIAEGTNV